MNAKDREALERFARRVAAEVKKTTPATSVPTEARVKTVTDAEPIERPT